MTKRQEQAIQTKKNIIETAKKLFLQKGFDNVTIDDISQSLSLSKGALYHHFKSKDEIVLWINRVEYDSFISDEIEPYLETEDTFVLINKYVHLCNRQAESMTCDLYKQYHRIISNISAYDDARLSTRKIYKLLEQIIIQGQKRGDISSKYSSKFYTDYLSSAFNGIYNYWAISNGEIDLYDFSQKTLDCLCKSIKQ